METHIEQGMLEREYQESIKSYRSLIRQGLDETLEKPGKVAQDLIAETRLLLDKNNTNFAKQTLQKLASHLKTMKSSFPTASAHIGHELKSSIQFIEETILASHLSSTLDRETNVHMEKARFAMQNEDWQTTREYIDKIIGHYLNKQQQRLLKEKIVGSIPDILSAIRSLQTNGAVCRSIQLKDIKKIFQLAAQQNNNVRSYSILASPGVLGTLFSSLSQTSFSLEIANSMDTTNCAVLRLSIDRQNTAYLLGIPFSSTTDIKTLGSVLQQSDRTLINIDDCILGKSTIEKLLITCLENIEQKQVFVGKGAISHALSESSIDIFRNLNIYSDNLNKSDVIKWATAAQNT
ncbi:MAG: hypothetical protein OEX19_00730 [Gammaproteobacteria bacterium]|nr:hypothetical protein [Gammaproteobacteria bacterium]